MPSADVVADVIADSIAAAVRPLLDRIAGLETQIAGLGAVARLVEVLDARLQDVATKDIGALRERIAVVEMRPPIPGPPGPPGKDGRDGLDVKDLRLTYDVHTRALDLHDTAHDAHAATTLDGVPAYRGVWQTKDYAPGDLVTHSGSTWHCNVATLAQPGESPDWTLMVKRGKDAR